MNTLRTRTLPARCSLLAATLYLSLLGCSTDSAPTGAADADIVLDILEIHEIQTIDIDIDFPSPTPDGGCQGNDQCIFADTQGLDPCWVPQCIEGICVLGVPVSAVSCDDKNPCTVDDVCGVHGCAGTPIGCDDGDLCTDDSCLDGGCVNIPNRVPCFDGDPCTVSDICTAGNCRGSTRSCEDANPCTAEYCDPGTGCIFTPQEGPCEDQDLCTEDDRCTAAGCEGTPLECDDANPCTEESCESSTGCTSDLLFGDCDDGNPCTENDTCGYGLCLPGFLDFEDPGCVSDTCGDKVCDTDESCLNCWWDCGHCCGDGFCSEETGENCATCGLDCGICSGCGDFICATEAGEDCDSCPGDCGICDDICLPAVTVQCGQVTTGSLFAPSTTNALDQYPCLESNHSGNEQAFKLKSHCDGIVHITLEKHGGYAGRLNLLVLDGAVPCRGEACLGAGVMDTEAPTKGSASASFLGWADHPYTVVVDGAQGALGTYAISVDCTCEFPDENCADMIDNDFDTQVDCADPECAAPCPIVGNGCASPYEIDDLPFQVLASTIGMSDSLSAPSECADIYAGKGAGAPDAIYSLEIPQTGLYSVNINATGTDFDTVLYLLSSCAPAPVTCPAAHNIPGNGGEQIYFLAIAGDKRSVVVDGASPEDSGAYTLNISFFGAVEVDCTDEIDDDQDGKTDCADSDCATSASCSQ